LTPKWCAISFHELSGLDPDDIDSPLPVPQVPELPYTKKCGAITAAVRRRVIPHHAACAIVCFGRQGIMHTSWKSLLRSIHSAAWMMLLGASIALASPIQYTDEFTGSGTLGNASFMDALVIISFTGDTSNVIESSGIFYNEVGTATVDVAGIGTATFTDEMAAFDNPTSTPSPAAGVGDFTVGASVLDTYNSAFADYNLQSAISPTSGSSFIQPELTFDTTLGGFNLSSGGDSTFTAVTTATPEPASCVFPATALLVLFWKRNRRRHSSASSKF
jgi:hypothetical protein